MKAKERKEYVLIIDGVEVARAKEVIIPGGKTEHKWIEVDEKIKEPEPPIDPMVRKLEQARALEEELNRLRTEIGNVKEYLETSRIG